MSNITVDFRGKVFYFSYKPIMYFLLSLSLTVMAFSTEKLTENAVFKKQYSKDVRTYLKNNSAAIHSHYPRVSYFLLGKPSYADIANACEKESIKRVLVIGPEKLVEYAINTYARQINDRVDYSFLPFYYYGDMTSKNSIFYSVVDRVKVISYQVNC